MKPSDRIFWVIFNLSCALNLSSGFATAQSISVGSLGAATAYEGGLLDASTGGLDPALWQGTSALLAANLIKTAPVQSDRAIIADLVKAALLSGGVPPEAERDADKAVYDQIRLKAILKMGDGEITRALIKRVPALVGDPETKADMALLTGDNLTACSVADNITDGRAEPVWARLRAVCHILRDEVAAAQLTTELLAQSGYEDRTFYKLMDILLGGAKPSKATQSLNYDEALDVFMAELAGVRTGIGPLAPYLSVQGAIDLELSDRQRLEALFKASSFMTLAQIGTVLKGFANSESHLAGEAEVSGVNEAALISYNLERALSEPPPKALGQLFILSVEGDSPEIKAKAIVEFLKRAEAAGKFDRFSELVNAEARLIPYNIQVLIGLKTFTRLAVNTADIGALQSLYHALETDSLLQMRLALISDALGNGFFGGGLGLDIETRLQDKDMAIRTQAVRESYIALALGAKISDAASTEITQSGKGNGRAAKAGALIALQAAARRGARAETALRTASILAPHGPSELDAATLSSLILALRSAGLDNFAGRIAAEDFLNGL